MCITPRNKTKLIYKTIHRISYFIYYCHVHWLHTLWIVVMSGAVNGQLSKMTYVMFSLSVNIIKVEQLSK